MTHDSQSKLAAQGYLHNLNSKRIAQWSRRTDMLTHVFAIAALSLGAGLVAIATISHFAPQWNKRDASLSAFIHHAEKVQGAAESDYDLLRAARCKATPALCKN